MFVLSLSIPKWNIPPSLIQIEFGPVTSSDSEISVDVMQAEAVNILP